MVWLTWRQSRLQAVTAAVIVGAFGSVMGITGPLLADMYTGSSLGRCHVSDCGAQADDFLQALYDSHGAAILGGIGPYWLLFLLSLVIILAIPAVIGMFWGAPLIAREFEAGTHYLVWNQSITRTRWLAIKLSLAAAAAIGFVAALSRIQNWWATPITAAVDRGACCTPMALNQFNPLVFAVHGVTPLAYAAFALALGVTAGVLIRRAVPAMALVLVVFAVLQLVMPLMIRPHLVPPAQAILRFSSFDSINVPIENDQFTVNPDGWADQPEAWVLSSDAVDAAGRPVSTVPAECLQPIPGVSGKATHMPFLECLDSHGVRVAIRYQPANRYWTFQWIETAIYAAFALALAGYCFWRIRRRLS